MHQQGWKLVSGGIVYTFARCEPEDVIYQLDYNEASHKDSEAYRQMFADSGWEYIQDFAARYKAALWICRRSPVFRTTRP